MKALLWISLVGLASSAAFASVPPVCGTTGATTLQNLINLGSTGCTIGDKLLYGFGVTGLSQLGTSASGINIVTPTVQPEFDPAIAFDGPFKFTSSCAENGSCTTSADFSLWFDVQVLPGGNAIEDASLTMGGFAFLPANGKKDDSISVTEDLCLGGTITAGSSACNPSSSPNTSFFVFDSTKDGQNTSNDIKFPLGATYTTIGVFKDILLSAAGSCSEETCKTSTVAFSSIGQAYSEVPEPISIILLGTCMVLVGPALRRRFSKEV